MKSAIRILGVVASVGMFFVLVTGATVTNTGSEQGCGKSWPLCHGKLVPQMAAATAIEWSHRADALLETLLILPLAAGAFALYRRRREIQVLASTMVLFIFLQAGLGAWAVMYPQQAAILALHFGVSLLAFASVLLTTVVLFEARGSEKLRERAIPGRFTALAWGVAAYSYLVVYLGAYVRHAKADLACAGWPTCNGALVPALRGAVGQNFAHRLAAGVLMAAVLLLAAWSFHLRERRPDLFRGSAIALVAVALQALSGAVVVFTRLDIFSALAHAALAGLLFGSLSYVCLHVLPLHAADAVSARRWAPRRRTTNPARAGR
ncbi:MAG: heme A synthase CtaA [Chloroflexota bacterium]